MLLRLSVSQSSTTEAMKCFPFVGQFLGRLCWNPYVTADGKGRELADMMERRKVDILCVQETRWKGSKARSIGAGFKLFYYGVDSKRNGVGVVLKEEFVRNVLEVKRVSDRVMSLKLEIEGVMLNVVSGYAPQVGCELEEKERFWSELDEVMESIPTGERVVIGADFNGHVGEGNTGDEEVMGKFGVKERNLEGQMVVDFAKRMDMGVVNTYFQKREEHRVTYKSGGRRTQVVLPDDWETTAEVIRETGRKVLGVSSGRRKEDKETWWWNEEVQDSIQRKRLAKKKWDMDRTEENRQEYKELQRRVKREVSKAKQKAYDELYTRLDTREGEKDLYRLARQRDRDGKDVQQKVDKIRKDEVRKALKRMKSGKAVGPDDIPVEVWKCLGEAAVEFLASLFNRVLENLEKAYDRVPREELWYCMRKSGVAGKYVRVVQDMYERSRTVVRCAVGQTEEFNVEVGLHQGSALSPFLFAIVMDQLSEEVRQESPWTMMFADDIVICSESREQVEENLERWRFALERRGMKVSRIQSNGECGKEKISARIKGKVYRTVVRPAMLYGLETVSLRKRQESELEVAELKMLREARLRWFGHVQRREKDEGSMLHALEKHAGFPPQQYYSGSLKKMVSLLVTEVNIGHITSAASLERCMFDSIHSLSVACVPLVTCPEVAPLIVALLNHYNLCRCSHLSEDFIKAVNKAWLSKKLLMKDEAVIALWCCSLSSLEQAVLLLLEHVLSDPKVMQNLETVVTDTLLPKASALHCHIFLIVNDVFRNALISIEENLALRGLLQVFTSCFLQIRAAQRPQERLPLRSFFPHVPHNLLTPLLTAPSDVPKHVWLEHLSWIWTLLGKFLSERNQEEDSGRGHRAVFETWFLLVQCGHWIDVAAKLLVSVGSEQSKPLLFLLTFYHHPTNRGHQSTQHNEDDEMEDSCTLDSHYGRN
ncbi:hypothetical protein QTP70_034381 [Hemibagrus guttatus]|uniref:ribonuclease H n=1 Tax=Hemibagrus guttatus TaxID=175788 RepID=A0AAE0R3C9_9TELE|nr:hypothetical protein QTP70_034381 [Hemibagrus guttatus]